MTNVILPCGGATIRPYQTGDQPKLDQLTETIFGPGIKTRAAHVLRGATPHEPELSFVAEHEDQMIGSVRQTVFLVGETRALLLGPLGVLADFKNSGIGRSLMTASMEAAAMRARALNAPATILVGDEPYYKPFGFERVPFGSIKMPLPVDPGRILICRHHDDAPKLIAGVARPLVS
ncbi:MAG: N-acetyltransferase [Pseudomonadota bacterium]